MKFLRALVLLVFVSSTLAAEIPTESESQPDMESLFAPWQREFSLGAGVFFSPFIATSGRPTVNYSGGFAQLGWMLNDLNEGGLWRGNFEIVGEAFGGGVFEGRGTYVASGSLFLRYNVVIPGLKLAPYIQVGGSVGMLDIDRKIFGQALSFGPRASVGVRYFFREKTSFNAEWRFQHFSNAGMSTHNLGINAQGAALSLSWYF